MSTLDQQFQAWEQFIRARTLWTKRKPDGLEVREADDKVEERWVQKYVEEEYRQLGFSKVDGPRRSGPDFRVSKKRRWGWAEVETCWQNYRKHSHHLNPEFNEVEYLILLSSETPPADKLPGLPPQIIHIDRGHFLAWFKDAVSKPQMDNVRINILAGSMQEHWTAICRQKDRDMATCPNCDDCAYFGEGLSGEATPFFQNLAAEFIVSQGTTDAAEFDLRKLNAASLKRFIEENQPA
jgi:hypothetical protein